MSSIHKAFANKFASLVMIAMLVFPLFNPSAILYAEESVPSESPESSAPAAPSAVATDSSLNADSGQSSPDSGAASSEGGDQPAAPSSDSDATNDVAISATSTDDEVSDTVVSEAAAEVDVTSTPIAASAVVSGSGTASTSTARSNTVIDTGDAIAVANVLNVVNTNLVNSEGYIVFSNIFDNQNGVLDFRNVASTTGVCGFLSCDADEVRLNIANNASIENGISLVALTGSNEIDAADAATIYTGDAFAGLNLINVANTNFVDSNYVLITLNAFRDVNGDIVFPSLRRFSATSTSGASILGADINNSADVQNNVQTDARTGDNEIDGIGASRIDSGDANSFSNIYNQLNTTLAGGDNVSVLFKIHGNWNGEIYGVPKGFTIVRGTDGSVFLMSDPNGDADNNAAENGGVISGNSDNNSDNTDITLSGTNTARIHNDVNILALTGDNKITGAETALVSTGNAYAGANLVNIANANVISRNWMMAIVNIFGDFNGDIAFGRPDLWIGATADNGQPFTNGSEITYVLTLRNNGDSDATNLKLTSSYDKAYQDITGSTASFTTTAISDSEATITWDLGNMEPGETKEISYKAKIKDAPAETALVSRLNVQARETDNNTTDNSDVITIHTGAGISSGSTNPIPNQNQNQQNNQQNQQPNNQQDNNQNNQNPNNPQHATIRGLVVERITDSISAKAGGTAVKQKLIVKNPFNETLKNVTFYDVLHDVQGKVVQNEKFELGDLAPYDEVSIEYEMAFGADAEAGIYVMSSLLTKPGSIDVLLPVNGKIYVSASDSDKSKDNLDEEKMDTMQALLTKKDNGLGGDGDDNQGMVAGASIDGDDTTGGFLGYGRSLKGLLTDIIYPRTIYADTGEFDTAARQANTSGLDLATIMQNLKLFLIRVPLLIIFATIIVTLVAMATNNKNMNKRKRRFGQIWEVRWLP